MRPSRPISWHDCGSCKARMISSHDVPTRYNGDSLTLYRRGTTQMYRRGTTTDVPTRYNVPSLTILKPSGPRAEVNKVAAQARLAFAARAKPACSRSANRLAPLRGAGASRRLAAMAGQGAGAGFVPVGFSPAFKPPSEHRGGRGMAGTPVRQRPTSAMWRNALLFHALSRSEDPPPWI